MKVKVATPISHLFENEISASEIASVSDCLECRDRSVDSVFEKQELFHCDMDIIKPWDDGIKRYLQKIIEIKQNLKVLSFHIASNCSKPLVKGNIFYHGGKRYSIKEMLKNSITNINWLRTLDKDIIFAVENNNYYPTPAYLDITDGYFLKQVIEENNIRFLFDIAHGMVTAHNLKINFLEYVETLPLNNVIQLHICQPNLSEEIARDVHELPTRSTLEYAYQFIQRCPIEYMTIEYYKNKDHLVNLIREIKNTLTD